MGHLLKSFFSSPDEPNDTHWLRFFSAFKPNLDGKMYVLCVWLNTLVLLNGQTIWPCCQHSIHLTQSSNSNFRNIQWDQIQSLFPDNLFV